ncbi:MAG TPA: hypothetical protein DDW52_03285 [Planctomycetaceae bacterium]|nr:hypothetical protein [Planctomycetaceae bacterium]
MRHPPTLMAIAYALIGTTVCGSASAQVAVWKKGQTEFEPPGYSKVDRTNEVGVDFGQAAPAPEEIDLITITPAAEPVPPLKYEFWWHDFRRNPGDASLAVSRAINQYLAIAQRKQLDKTYAEETRKWDEFPGRLSEPLVDFLSQHRDVLNVLYAALEMRDGHSETVTGTKSGFTSESSVRLAEIQQLRALARLIQLDVAHELANGRFDDAIRKLRCGFRLAKHATVVADFTLVGNLVGMATTGIMLGEVEKLAGQPDAPNTYWALASLTDRNWDFRSAIYGELQNIERLSPGLFNEVDANASEVVASRKLIESVQGFLEETWSLGAASSEEKEVQVKLLAGTALLAFEPICREDLRDRSTFPELDNVANIAPSTAVLLSTGRQLKNEFQQIAKWCLLPDGTASDPLDKAMQNFSVMEGGVKPHKILAGLLLPAFQAAESASNRTANTVRRQMFIEALRAYAAKHGTLPESLDDPILPYPLQSPSRRPFGYECIDTNNALLRYEPGWPGDKGVVRIKLAN